MIEFFVSVLLILLYFTTGNSEIIIAAGLFSIASNIDYIKELMKKSK